MDFRAISRNLTRLALKKTEWFIGLALDKSALLIRRWIYGPRVLHYLSVVTVAVLTVLIATIDALLWCGDRLKRTLRQ